MAQPPGKQSWRVTIKKMDGAYNISLRIPPGVTPNDMGIYGFGTRGTEADVTIDSTASVVNPKGKQWSIHHADSTKANPDIVLAQVKQLLEQWLEELGFKAQFSA